MNISNTRRRGDNGDTPFGEWMRLHHELDSRIYGLDNENIDYASFLYILGYFMLLEEKQGYTKFPSFAQCDTHGVLDQICKFACSHPDFRAKRLTQGRPEKITYRGYHLVQFEKTNPDDGGIHLNGMPVTKEQLLHFLQGKWDPVVQYQHMRKHQGLLLDIMDCKTEEDLIDVKDHIVSAVIPSIDPKGPEINLLRAVFKEKSKEIKEVLYKRIDQVIRDVEGEKQDN